MTRGKRPATGNGVGASSLEIRTGNLSKSVICGHVFEPKLNAQQGAICEAFFWKCFEQSTSWCFGSRFFLIDSLPFATVVFWLHLKTKTKFKCNGVEWSKDRTQAAESIKWRPQQAYSSNHVLLVQPQTVFSTPKIITLTHR